MAKGRKESEEVIVISIDRGILSLIEPYDGLMHHYRQWGIEKLSRGEIHRLVQTGKLDREWAEYPRVPYNYILTWEDPEVQGGSIGSKPRKFFKEE